MVTYNNLIKVKTYKKRMELLKLQNEIHEIEVNIAKEHFKVGKRAKYISYCGEDIEGEIIAVKGLDVILKIDKINDDFIECQLKKYSAKQLELV